jgi:hypothetical protein
MGGSYEQSLSRLAQKNDRSGQKYARLVNF